MSKPSKNLRQKYLESMLVFEEYLPDSDAQLMVAICAVQLTEYERAQRMFRAALDDFVWAERKMWFISNQPHWLTDTYFLANSPTLYEATWQALNTFSL